MRHWVRGLIARKLNVVPDAVPLQLSALSSARRYNSAVYATTTWIASHVAECPLRVLVDGEPGDHWADPVLAQIGATSESLTLDLLTTGNAYLDLDRDNRSVIVGVRWRPAHTVTYDRAQGAFKDSVGAALPADTLAHFRLTPDPENPTLGRSPLDSLKDEVAVDDEAGAAALHALRTRGTPWILATPDNDALPPTPAQADELTKRIADATSPLSPSATFLPWATKLAFPPTRAATDYAAMRNTPEERVTAIYHVAASVVGLGTGLQQTKVGATFKEARQQSWMDGVLPVMRRLARQVGDLLVLEDKAVVEFDTERIAELQEDKASQTSRVLAQVAGGVLSVQTAQAMLNIPVDARADVYYLPAGLEPVPVGELDIALPTLPPSSDASPGDKDAG